MGKKFKVSLVFGVLVALLLSACSQSSAPDSSSSTSTQPSSQTGSQTAAPSDEPVEIKWLQWWVNEWGPDNHAQLVANFERDNPGIKVTVVDVPWPQMQQKLSAAAAGSESYDVLGMEGSWIPGLVKLGYLESFEDFLAQNPDVAAKMTGIREYQGKPYSACLYMNVYAFAYNVDLFEEAGLEPPTSWDEFVAVLEALRDVPNQKYGMSMPLADASFILTRYFGFRLAQEGGQWLDANGKVAFNSDAGVRALEFWRDLYNRDLIVPGSFGEDQTLMLELFASGQVPAIIDGPFIASKSKQIDPNIRVAYAPGWSLNTAGYQWACSGISVSAKSPNKEAAWKFVEYLYSDEVALEMTEKLSLAWATNPAMDSLASSSDPMLSRIPEFNRDPAANLVSPILPDSTAMMDALKIAFQDVLANKKDAKTALDEAAKIWQDAFDAAD